MRTKKAIRDHGRAPTHPGALLREDILPALGIPVLTAANQLGVSRQTLHRLLAERLAVSPAMALRLGKFCGNGPEPWLNMQRAYDLWRVEREMAGELAKIPTHRAA